MNIVYRKTTFGELKGGDVFAVVKGSEYLFMKLSDRVHVSNTNGPFNSVRLNDGMLFTHKDNCEAFPINCSIQRDG